MKHKKILTFMIVYIFLVLIAAYSFSFYRGRQIDEFLEKKNSEYQSSVCCTKEDIETMEDWEIAHTGKP